MRILVLPAASRPSINRRISFDPKILSSSLDTELPMFCSCGGVGFSRCSWFKVWVRLRIYDGFGVVVQSPTDDKRVGVGRRRDGPDKFSEIRIRDV